MTVATSLAVEVLHCHPESWFAKQALDALDAAAGTLGIPLTMGDVYHGVAPWLVLWGPGAPDRAEILRQHVAAGGHVIALDLAYWHRDRKFRVSIDAAHPQAWVMRRDLPRSRWQQDNVGVADRWNPEGPVLVAGIGMKAKAQYGTAVDIWEAEMMAECHAKWPELAIVYRPKVTQESVPIEHALIGASLVLTWHSNVAVDAIRMGIPVICRDGAAAAVCPDRLTDNQPLPLLAYVRNQFLGNLSYFQWGWTPNEAQGCWQFLQELLS